MAQGRFCVGMLHYEVLSETGRVVHVYDTSFPWKEAVSVDIPETVSYNGKDYTVIAIGANAFASCCSLQAIKIPNSVTKIGKYAFWGCDSLRSVQIPNSVTEIGADAFLGCHLLRTVRISNSVTVIGDGAFAGCRSLSAVGIPNSVTEIGRGAFEGCHSLRTVRIPSSVAKIGDRAFFNCRSLQSITVDAGKPIDASRIPTCYKENCKFIGYYTTPEGPLNPLSGKLTDLVPIYSDYTFYASYEEI